MFIDSLLCRRPQPTSRNVFLRWTYNVNYISYGARALGQYRFSTIAHDSPIAPQRLGVLIHYR